jgi:hypothetical protein
MRRLRKTGAVMRTEASPSCLACPSVAGRQQAARLEPMVGSREGSAPSRPQSRPHARIPGLACRRPRSLPAGGASAGYPRRHDDRPEGRDPLLSGLRRGPDFPACWRQSIPPSTSVIRRRVILVFGKPNDLSTLIDSSGTTTRHATRDDATTSHDASSANTRRPVGQRRRCQ